MLTVAGVTVDDSVSRTAILFIAQADGLQGYATHRLYLSLQEDTSQMALLQAGIWCIGEYGELLARQCPSFEGETGSQGGYPGVSEGDIVAMLEKLMKLHNADLAVKSISLNALIKLTVRLSPAQRPALAALIEPYKNSMSVELQQRSVEYSKLLSGRWEELRSNLLGKMPVLDEATLRKKRQAYDDSETAAPSSLLPSPA
jgi:AP-1 complex subunit gamma-1